MVKFLLILLLNYKNIKLKYKNISVACSTVNIDSSEKEPVLSEKPSNIVEPPFLDKELNMTMSFSELYYKYDLYKLLLNPNINIYHKVDLVHKENNNSIAPNITNGGLYKDWDNIF
jgi:hypothetical protein